MNIFSFFSKISPWIYGLTHAFRIELSNVFIGLWYILWPVSLAITTFTIILRYREGQT